VTDTPITDAEVVVDDSGYERVTVECARQLERELTAAKAEIERLTREYAKLLMERGNNTLEAYAKGFAEARDKIANEVATWSCEQHFMCGFTPRIAEKEIRAMKPDPSYSRQNGDRRSRP